MSDNTGAADTEQQSQTADEDKGTRGEEDLDSLLSEYNGSVSPTNGENLQSGQQPDLLKTLKDVQTRLERTEREAQEREYRESMGEAVKSLQGEDLSYLPAEMLEGFLEIKARQDQRLRHAWNDRFANPQIFNRILKGYRNQLVELIGNRVDKNVTQDREAVTASVRGASTKGSDKPKYSQKDLDGMTDREFFEKYDKGEFSSQE